MGQEHEDPSAVANPAIEACRERLENTYNTQADRRHTYTYSQHTWSIQYTKRELDKGTIVLFVFCTKTIRFLFTFHDQRGK